MLCCASALVRARAEGGLDKGLSDMFDGEEISVDGGLMGGSVMACVFDDASFDVDA